MLKGLGFRPRPRTENIDSTLIWFKNGNNEDNWKYWSDSLQDFLERKHSFANPFTPIEDFHFPFLFA